MPNTKSAINSVKRVKKQTLVNKLRKNKYKSALRKIHKLIEKKDAKKIKEYLHWFLIKFCPCFNEKENLFL